jgi:hypothetical protein
MNKKALVWRQIVPAVLAVVVILFIVLWVSDAGAQVKEGMKCEGKGGVCQDEPCRYNQINLGTLACKEKGQHTRYCCKTVEEKTDTPPVVTAPPQAPVQPLPGQAQATLAEEILTDAAFTINPLEARNKYIDAYEQARSIILELGRDQGQVTLPVLQAFQVALTSRMEIEGGLDETQCALYGLLMKRFIHFYEGYETFPKDADKIMQHKQDVFARYPTTVQGKETCKSIADFEYAANFLNDALKVDEDRTISITQNPIFAPEEITYLLPSFESKRLHKSSTTGS